MLPAFRTQAGACLSLLTLLSLGCGPSNSDAIVGRRATVACGRCVFKMPQAQGCPFAIELEGKHYLMQGKLPVGHVNHAPDGICNVPRTAHVDGRIVGNHFIATRVDLEPLAPEELPDKPRFTPADEH